MASGICKCSSSSLIVVNPGNPCSSENCVSVPHIVVPAEHSVLPCNQSLVVDFDKKIGFDTNQDKAIAIIEVLSYSDNLKDVSFVTANSNNDIELHLTSNFLGYPNEDYKFGKVTYKVTQGLLSDWATITVIFKTLCVGVSIPVDKYCDPCTGLLVDKPTNVSVNLEDSNVGVSNIKVK